MNVVSKIKENPLLSLLIILLILLGIVFVVVLCFENPKRIFNLLGVSEKEQPKYEVLKFLGIGMGGILIALQALMSYKRAKAMEDTAKAQADAANAQADAAQAQARATEEQARANENTEQGLRQERLKNAIEHLGDEKDTVRLGGAYELFHLVEDSKDLRKTALDMLCLHIRQTTGEYEYREKHKSKPSEEIQSLLTLLFLQEHKVFRGLQINLQGSWLNGANLREARLQRAVLAGSYLQNTRLDGADLKRANLVEAHLQEASLSEAHLQKADLFCVRLQGAYLEQARLQGARLMGGFLQATNLNDAYLQGAILRDVRLQGANLSGVRLQGACLSFSYLQGATLSGAKLQGAGEQSWTSSTPFAYRIRKSINKESDLSRLVSGGVGQGGVVDSLCEGLTDDNKKMVIRESLRQHIGKPVSYGLPENSGAITGAYTKEEAEQWIAEYEKAMSEVPEEDS